MMCSAVVEWSLVTPHMQVFHQHTFGSKAVCVKNAKENSASGVLSVLATRDAPRPSACHSSVSSDEPDPTRPDPTRPSLA